MLTSLTFMMLLRKGIMDFYSHNRNIKIATYDQLFIGKTTKLKGIIISMGRVCNH